MVKLLPHEHRKLNLMPGCMNKVRHGATCLASSDGKIETERFPGVSWPVSLTKWVSSRPGSEPVDMENSS